MITWYSSSGAKICDTCRELYADDSADCDLIDGEAERRDLLAIEIDAQLRRADLQVRVDVLQAGDLAQRSPRTAGATR